MAGKKRVPVPHDHVSGQKIAPHRSINVSGDNSIPSHSHQVSPVNAFFQRYALTIIIFLISLFFILTITNPALYTNDEWITANQLHQLNLGHQVTFSEGKYGVTENGTVSAYFTSRQNVLMYSLALPITALPGLKMFGLMGENFRLIVILIWSLCPVLIALLAESYYPAYSRIRGIRLIIPALLLSLFLFVVNLLLYKQFPFSAPDAPSEVAALVLANHLFFALTVVIVFETCRLIHKNIWMALFGAFACIACSTYIFWAGTAKDHMLTAAVLACIIYFFVLWLSYGRWRDATLSFVCSGLLIWVRPEVGFFVTIFTGLFFSIPLFRHAVKREIPVRNLLISFLSMAGVLLGGIPFFINNLLITHNWLIPAFDLPRAATGSGMTVTSPLPIGDVVAQPAEVNQIAELNLIGTLLRVGDMITHAIFRGFSFDNIIQGFSGVMIFPANDSIGFLIICPLIAITIFAFILWNKKISWKMDTQKKIFLFLLVMIFPVFFSYLAQLSSMNISQGVLPDMRYLSPAYIPCGLFSILVLSKTPLVTKPKMLLKSGLLGAIILVPLLFFFVVLVHPFGNEYAGYAAFFKFVILTETVLCLGMMIIARFYSQDSRFFTDTLPWFLVLIIITVFSFQFMLTFIYAVVIKMNGYPFWIPLVREGFSLFIEVRYLPPV